MIEETPLIPVEDQQWLDEQLIDARREFDRQVYEAHLLSRLARSEK